MDVDAPSTAYGPRQMAPGERAASAFPHLRRAIESLLEAERAQLPLWVPVAFMTGIGAWFALPTPSDWMALLALCLAVAAGALGVARGRGRFWFSLGIGALLMAAGCLLIWGKALWIASPVLARPALVEVTGQVESVARLQARGVTRLILRPEGRTDMPSRIRINLADADRPDGVSPRAGDRLRLHARLMPPAPPTLPGGYDFARRAWFDGIGATGRALPPVVFLGPLRTGAGVRERLSAHVAHAVPGAGGALAVTLATGDQGGISAADEDAMRASGLAHLLSISGVHVTALVGAVVFIVYRLLALSTRLALRWPLMLVSAAAGAGAGIGYTVLTGAEVPTIRSCVAALLVMGGLALGREAISLRLIATGALIVLLFWPESAIGPSFQLSFAAVATIVSLHEHPAMRRLIARREEAIWARTLRSLGGLLLTGLVVEAALAPIALYHFHRQGVLGAFANMIAIPLTELVVMPAEALALLLDLIGLGAPLWWIVGKALAFLLLLAHFVADQSGAMLLRPAIAPIWFLLFMGGLIWCLLWRTRLRWLGLPILGIALAGYVTAPVPDVLVSADGHHVALRKGDGGWALLRDRAGDYVRDSFAEQAAFAGEMTALADSADARCSADFCVVALPTDRGIRHLLIARSRLNVPWRSLVEACARADIVVADRPLPLACAPRLLKLDRRELSRAGGAAIFLATGDIRRSRDPNDTHPWIRAARSALTRPPVTAPRPQL